MVYKKTDQTLIAKGNIKKERLSKTQFMVSLLREGFNEGLIEKPVIDRIGLDIMLLLKELITRYTKGESTSLKVDTAEMLMNSVCYSVDAGLADCSSPEECITLLKAKPLEEVYYAGVKRLTDCVEEIRGLVVEMKKIRLDIPIEAYNATIESVPTFFIGFNIMFTPHDSVPSIDYPLAFDDWNVRGVYYMKNYIKTLNLETKVCRLFEVEDIKSVLECYGEVYNIDYGKCLINIFELTINNAAFSVLSGHQARQLMLSEEQYSQLSKTLSRMNAVELKSNINEAFETMIRELDIRASEQIDYILRYKDVFLASLKSSIKIRRLDKLIMYSAENAAKLSNSVILEHGERLSEKSFLSLFRELTKCRSVSEKANIIMSCIHCSEDFIDILESDCFYGDEYLDVFSQLGDIELSILGKVVFYEELRDGKCELSKIEVEDIRADREWQQKFVQFLKTLDSRRSEEVERYINTISFEKISAYAL